MSDYIRFYHPWKNGIMHCTAPILFIKHINQFQYEYTFYCLVNFPLFLLGVSTTILYYDKKFLAINYFIGYPFA